ncbi:MAG: OFA family MFS transporter [Erysipelotrichaceae bacterium]|nr:OFA family MFS transporter [Erysipelotrichaceae bacterium]MDD3809271.1 OFA family MFS transporter [Erysipelotrichaceae bacterium]
MDKGRPSRTVEDSKIYRWLFVVLGTAIMLFLGTVYSYSVFRIAIETKFDIHVTQSGLPYMMALSSYALFMFLTGRHIESYKPRNILLIGGFLVASGWILSAFAPNIYVFTLTYGLISGAGVGVAYGIPMTVVSKWFPENKGVMVGIVLIGFGLSPLISAPIIRILMGYLGLMNTFLALGIAFMVLLPLLAFPFAYPHSDGKSDHDIEHEKGLTTTQMVKTREFKGVYLNFIFGTMVGLTLVGMTSKIGIEFIKLDSNQVMPLLSLFAVFNGLGRPAFGWLTDRVHPRNAMLLSYAMIAFASILLIVSGSEHLLIYIIAFCIYWFNLGGWLAIAPTSTMQLFGFKYYSKNYGLVFTAYGIGAILGVLSSGMILDIQHNYYLIFYYLVILCVLGVISSLVFFREKK